MATYYWVGGSGSWDAASTTNWASSSGGSGAAGDDYFDRGHNANGGGIYNRGDGR